MKTFGLSLLIVGLSLAALPVQAQETGQTSFTLETHVEGGDYFFAAPGETTHNPTLNAAPGQEITVTVKGIDSNVHNFCVDLPSGQECSDYVQAAGDEQTLTFTAPASGSVDYFCQPHKGSGMKGTMTFGTASATTPAGSDGDEGGEAGGNDSPGLPLAGLAVALVGAALLLRRK